MGTPSYATEILKALILDEDIEVVALVTQPDKPVGRKQILTPPDTKRYLLELEKDIPIYQPDTLKSDEALKEISSFKADYIVVAAFGQILPKSILDLAPCINLHASILPAYRGASPIQDAILNLEDYSGVTAMKMDIGLDSGDILGYSFLKVANLTAVDLFEKLSILASTLTIKTLKNYNQILPVKQYSCDKSYAKKISKSDGLLDLLDAKKCEAKYRAFIFWPGVFIESGLKLKELSLYTNDDNHDKGQILDIKDDSIVLSCKVGSLKITKVQPPSKKEMSVIDYIRGKRLQIGDHLS
jgi:methionyl-tRNA formyltransferase